MWRRNLLGLSICMPWLLTVAAAFAADVRATELQLSLSDPRPVAKAVEILNERHGLAITYEDPPYAFADDLKDVTATVAGATAKPGQRILIPRGGSFAMTYPLPDSAGKPDRVAALIQKVLDTHLSAGGSQFVVVQNDDVFHVVPAMVKNRAGAFVASHSILDTPITLPVESRSGLQMVNAICDALVAAKVKVGVGTVPASALAGEQIVDGGASEPARDILSRSLKQVSTQTGAKLGEERPYVWQLLYDPSTRVYFLNLTLASPQPNSLASPAEDPPPDPKAPDPATARPKR